MSRRIRQVRREFWSDTTVGKWPDDARLLYIGLWCLADDDGYLEYDVEAIAADLFRFRGPSRLRNTERLLTHLTKSARLVILDCGLHARIPTLPVHQVISGRKNYDVRDQHQRVCGVAGRGLPGPAVAIGKERNGEERNGSPAGAREAAPPATTDDAVVMPGTPGWESLGETLAALAKAPRRRQR